MESRLEHRQSREQQTCTESFPLRLGQGGSERVGMGGGFMGSHRVLSGGDAHSLFFYIFIFLLRKRSSTTHGPRVERPPRYKRAPGPSPQAFRVVLSPPAALSPTTPSLLLLAGYLQPRQVLQLPQEKGYLAHSKISQITDASREAQRSDGRVWGSITTAGSSTPIGGVRFCLPSDWLEMEALMKTPPSRGCDWLMSQARPLTTLVRKGSLLLQGPSIRLAFWGSLVNTQETRNQSKYKSPNRLPTFLTSSFFLQALCPYIAFAENTTTLFPVSYSSTPTCRSF